MVRKIFLPMIMLALLISGCAPAMTIPSTATAAKVSPSTPTAAQTEATVTASPSPEAQASPTATDIPVDGYYPGHPEAGPKPSGEKVYFDTKTNEWTKPNLDNSEKPFYWKEVAQGWYTDIIVNPTYQGGIPLINEKGFRTGMVLNVFGEEGLQYPTLQHIESGDTIIPDPSFPRLLLGRISAIDPNNKDIIAWEAAWNAGSNVPIPFTTPQGKYIYNTGSAMNIYIKKTELSNPDYSQKSYLQASISGDDQGNLNVIEYSPMPIESMSPGEFIDRYLRYPFMIFYTGDMSQGTVLNKINNPALGFLSNSATGPNPYFIVKP